MDVFTDDTLAIHDQILQPTPRTSQRYLTNGKQPKNIFYEPMGIKDGKLEFSL